MTCIWCGKPAVVQCRVTCADELRFDFFAVNALCADCVPAHVAPDGPRSCVFLAAGKAVMEPVEVA